MPPGYGQSPGIDPNDPNYYFTPAGRADRLARIDGYATPSAYTQPPPTAAPVAQPGAPAAPGGYPAGGGLPYPGWQPPTGPVPAPDPALAERERYERQLAEERAQRATLQGVLQYVQNDLAQRNQAQFDAYIESLDPETAINELRRHYGDQLNQRDQALRTTAEQSQRALLMLHADNFTQQEVLSRYSLTPEQRQAILDMPIDASTPQAVEAGANARASVAAAWHQMNEQARQLGIGNAVAIHAASGVSRLGGIAPSGPAPQAMGGQYPPGYSNDPVLQAIRSAPWFGSR